MAKIIQNGGKAGPKPASVRSDGTEFLSQLYVMATFNGQFVLGVAAAGTLLRPMLRDMPVESMAVAHLDASYRLLGLRLHEGCEPDRMPVPIRELLRDALGLDSRRIVVAHNHPSGCAMPSQDDLRATRELARTMREADIRLIDHLVFAGDACTSFRALGLI